MNEIIIPSAIAIITALAASYRFNKSNKLLHITEQRKNWREQIREGAFALRRLYDKKCSSFNSGNDNPFEKNDNLNNNEEIKFTTFSEAKVYFQQRLNPYDNEDNEILEKFDELINNSNDNLCMLDKVIKNIELRLQTLLKYEWEKAKQEATTFNIIINAKIFLSSILFYLVYKGHIINLIKHLTRNDSDFLKINIISGKLLNYFFSLKTIYFIFGILFINLIFNLIELKLSNFHKNIFSYLLKPLFLLKIPFRKKN